MFFYITYVKIQSMLVATGLNVDITIFSDFEKVVTFLLFNILYYFFIYLFIRICYKLLYKLYNFIF